MNLSPRRVTMLTEAGFEAAHWSTVGALNAPDTEIGLPYWPRFDRWQPNFKRVRWSPSTPPARGCAFCR